jgi:two-component system phosphate regulon sensor histidine kinase PhoR
MKDIARRVWLATGASVIAFAIYEFIKTLLYPQMSAVTSHLITVIVAGVLTFFVSRYALARYSAAISQIKRQTVMTEETNQLLGGVLETMIEGVIIVDSEMNIVLHNAAAARIMKLPGSEEIKINCDSPLLPRAPAPLLSSPRRLIDVTRDPAIHDAFRLAVEERRAVERRIEMTDREARSFQLNVAPLGGDLAVGVFFDITRMERLERVRREFFANLSHELRTPLTAILAYSDTLLAGGMDDEENRARFVERVHKHASRMNELISDISDLSAIESGDVKLSLAPVRVASVVSEVMAMAEGRRSDCDLTFQTRVPDDLYAMADLTRLDQILYNLVDNAIKFNHPGGSVTVWAESRDGKAMICVEDTGAGIGSQDLPRVFERLYRADKSRSRRIEGTGLGLAIVKHLAQAHGGEVFATSELGRGSTFTIALPLAAAPKAEDRKTEP